MFEDSSNPVRWLGNGILFALLGVSIIYGTSLFYDPDRSDFIRLNYPPRILSSENLEPTDHFRRGEGMVMEYDVTKFEIGCYAEYTHTFSGPVSFQISTGKSRAIGSRGQVQEFVLKSYMEIPKHVPVGDYKVQLAVFPTCDGYPRDPFVVLDPAPVIHITE